MRRHTLLFYRDPEGSYRYSRRVDAVANARLVTGYRVRPGIKVAATDD